MLDNVRDGFLGLFLVLGQWLSPGGERPEITVVSVKYISAQCIMQCGLSMGWNDELESLVDAGIPLRLRLSAFGENGDSSVFVRTLQCDVTDLTYSFSDSVSHRDHVVVSKKYPQVLIALRDYARWTCALKAPVRSIRIEAELLPSVATRLNRTVDMAGVWGQRKVSRVVVLEKSRRSRISNID